MKSSRFRYFLGHLAISAAVIGVTIAFILLAWYPPPLAQLEGIFSILLLMAIVDACLGPLCTLVAASPQKPRPVLIPDLAVIVSVQLLALGYAVYTTGISRPVFIVYNSGQFDIEHANELSSAELAKAPPGGFGKLPLLGPEFVEARFPDDAAEAARIVQSAVMHGVDIKDMPQYYHAWPTASRDLLNKAQPIPGSPGGQALREAVLKLLARSGVAQSDAALFAVSGKQDRGTLVLRKSDLKILGIIPYLAP